MHANENFLQVAALLGEPSRAIVLNSLLDGRMMPASELAARARVSPQTMSSHLAKLVHGGLIVVEAKGRYKYYRLANPEVAQVLEGLTMLAGPPQIKSLRQSDQMKAIRYARTCYDHLAGQVGVQVTQSLVERGVLYVENEGYDVSPEGARLFAEIGVVVDSLRHRRRVLARQCLDWSERRYHLAGALGAAMTKQLFEHAWIRRMPETRAVAVTAEGRKGFADVFGIRIEEANAHS